jgi:hypothetical protein
MAPLARSTDSEFTQLIKGLQGERLRQAFRYFDKDGDGYIKPEEFQRIVLELAGHKLSDPVLERLPTLCTLSPGQKISYSEVIAFHNIIRGGLCGSVIWRIEARLNIAVHELGRDGPGREDHPGRYSEIQGRKDHRCRFPQRGGAFAQVRHLHPDGGQHHLAFRQQGEWGFEHEVGQRRFRRVVGSQGAFRSERSSKGYNGEG